MKSLFPGLFRTLLTLLLCSLLFTACAPAASPTPPPTQDTSTLVAAAVQTLSAQITAEAKAHPSATPVPPTPTLTPTETVIPPTATAAGPTATAIPTATSVPALSAQALYTTTTPENKREYIPNERFSLALGFKNTGTVTWAPGTKVKLVSYKGEVTVNPEVTTDQPVAPGDKIEFDLWAFGSETLGQHTWYFQIYTAQGVPIPGGSIAFSYTSH